jgi:hypothetical protein
MVVLRITNGFTRLSDPKLGSRASNIHLAMTGNPNFATPIPTLAAFQTGINEFLAASSEADNGGSYDKAVKNQKRDALIELLHSLAAYVLFTAAGTDNPELVAKSSGFSVAKTGTPSVLGAIENLQLKDGPNAGDLLVSFNTVVGARAFVYQYTDDETLAEGSWRTEVGTSRKVVLSGLQSGKKYFVRLIAIGAKDQKIISEVVSRLVQ